MCPHTFGHILDHFIFPLSRFSISLLFQTFSFTLAFDLLPLLSKSSTLHPAHTCAHTHSHTKHTVPRQSPALKVNGVWGFTGAVIAGYGCGGNERSVCLRAIRQQVGESVHRLLTRTGERGGRRSRRERWGRCGGETRERMAEQFSKVFWQGENVDSWLESPGWGVTLNFQRKYSSTDFTFLPSATFYILQPKINRRP